MVQTAGVATGGNMITGRGHQIAAVLPNGSILLAGGDTGPIAQTPTSSAEFYSLSTGVSNAPSMNVARAMAASAAMPDGTVLVTGGLNTNAGGPVNTAEYYNPKTNSFAYTTGQMTTSRYGHTATLLNNGQVLIAGGQDGGNTPLASAELYTESSGSFTATPQMVHEHGPAASAVLLANGNVLITGGADSCCIIPYAEVYNPTANTFTAVGNMQVARISHTSTLLPDGTVLITGGVGTSNQTLSSAEIFNPSTNTFTLLPSTMSIPRSLHTATLLGNGYVLVAGGSFTGNDYSCNATSSEVDLYNVGTQTFTNGGNLATARAAHTATLIGNSTLLIAGGYDCSDPVPTYELYNFDVDSGFIDLKYLVVGVLYAPPGSGSTVTYGQSSSIGETTAIDENIATNASVAVTNGIGASMKNKDNSISYSQSLTTTASYGYANDSSTTYALTKTIGNVTTVSGPINSGIGIDHDYDMIYIWFDPVLGISLPSLKAANGNSIVNWTGYAYNGCSAITTTNCDPNNYGQPDIIGIPVLCLKNPYLAPACTQYSIYTSRSWDQSGIGGLNASDYQNILNQDLFVANPNYSPQTDTVGNFVEANGTIQYPIPVQGAGSQTYTGTMSTANSTTQAQAITRTYGVSFAYDSKFSGNFLIKIVTEIKTTIGTTWTHKTSSSYASTETSSAAYSVKSPVSTDNYSGPIIMDAWTDQTFGTFMFFAPTRPTVPTVAPPATALEASAGSLTFGTTALGSTSAAQTVVFTNNSSVPMVMKATSFATTPSSFFAYSSDPSFTVSSDGCTGQTIAAGGTCSLSIVFSPILGDLPSPGSTTISGTLIAGGVQTSSGSTNVYDTIQIPVKGIGTR
jgi:hypothetical protein